MNVGPGDRVLLVAPRFFGYEREIGNELRRRGCVVDELWDRPFDTPLMHAVTRYARPAMIGAADRWYRARLEALGAADYALVLVVNGQTLSADVLRGLRTAFPRAAFVLYLWDSLSNRASVVRNLPHFDAALSFDASDASRYGLHFRPLFFAPAFERADGGDAATAGPRYDVSFVGTAHTDRYAVVRRVSEAIGPQTRRFWYLYLKAPWVYAASKLVKPAFRHAARDEFRFAPLGKEALAAVFHGSASVLDVEHPRQTGLTMRTFETLGSGKKLITTNAAVRDYDFFDARNIHVIDRAQVRIPADFFQAPYARPSAALYRKYSLGGWMDEVLAAAGDTGADSAPLADAMRAPVAGHRVEEPR